VLKPRGGENHPVDWQKQMLDQYRIASTTSTPNVTISATTSNSYSGSTLAAAMTGTTAAAAGAMKIQQ
jgi:hypothetical protein